MKPTKKAKRLEIRVIEPPQNLYDRIEVLAKKHKRTIPKQAELMMERDLKANPNG